MWGSQAGFGQDDQLTTDDVSRINKAMKTEKFGSLMQDYLNEISDPNNREEYDQYMEQLENKGELPEGTELLRCEPGFCVRTEVRFKNGQSQKCYINICYSKLLKDMTMEKAPEGGGMNISLPFSLSPPRVDQDKKKDTCLTCDFGISEQTFAQTKANPEMLRMMIDIATKNLSQNFLKGFEEVKNDFKVLSKFQCKGEKPYMMSVRSVDLKPEALKKKRKDAKGKKKASAATDGVTPGELREMKKEATDRMQKLVDSSDDEESSDEEEKKKKSTAAIGDKIRVPKHKLVHIGEHDFLEFQEAMDLPKSKRLVPKVLPKQLKLVIELPGIKSAADLDLNVESDNVMLEAVEKFYLDVPLPYIVNPDDGTAKFDKQYSTLTLTLPVIPNEENFKLTFESRLSSGLNSGLNSQAASLCGTPNHGANTMSGTATLENISPSKAGISPANSMKSARSVNSQNTMYFEEPVDNFLRYGVAEIDRKTGEFVTNEKFDLIQEDIATTGMISSTKTTEADSIAAGGVRDDDLLNSDSDSSADLDDDDWNDVEPLGKEEMKRLIDEKRKRKLARQGITEDEQNAKEGDSTTKKESQSTNEETGKPATSSTEPSSSTSSSTSSREEITAIGDFTTGTPYIASATYTGSKKGYYFGTGDKGTGYYRDEKLIQLGNFDADPQKKGPGFDVKFKIEKAKEGEDTTRKLTQEEILIEEIDDEEYTASTMGGNAKQSKSKSTFTASGGRDATTKALFDTIPSNQKVERKDRKQNLVSYALRSNPDAGKTGDSESSDTKEVFTFHGDYDHYNKSAASHVKTKFEKTEMIEDMNKHFLVSESSSHVILVFPVAEIKKENSSFLKDNEGIDSTASIIDNQMMIVLETPRTGVIKSSRRQIHLQYYGVNYSTTIGTTIPTKTRYVFEKLINRDLAVPQQTSYYVQGDYIIFMIRKEGDEIWGTTIAFESDIEVGTFTTEEEIEENDVEEEVEGENGAKKETFTPHIRSDYEGELAMAHSVLLQNKLWLELM